MSKGMSGVCFHSLPIFHLSCFSDKLKRCFVMLWGSCCDRGLNVRPFQWGSSTKWAKCTSTFWVQLSWVLLPQNIEFDNTVQMLVVQLFSRNSWSIWKLQKPQIQECVGGYKAVAPDLILLQPSTITTPLLSLSPLHRTSSPLKFLKMNESMHY